MIFEVEITTLGYFILATLVLIASPGPVVSLIIAETLTYSGWHGFAVSLGAATISIFAIIIVFLGLGYLAAHFEEIFTYIQYGGAIVLSVFAIQVWRSREDKGFGVEEKATTPWKAYKKAIIICALSPKTILFFSAFFPQFIEAERAKLPQFIVLGVTFIIVSVAFDNIWVFGARKARVWLEKRKARRVIKRISASFLAVGAVVLTFV